MANSMVRDDQFNSDLLLELVGHCDNISASLKSGSSSQRVQFSADLLSTFPKSVIKSVIEGRMQQKMNLGIDCVIDDQDCAAIISPRASIAESSVKKIPRPKNSFMIFRQEVHASVAAKNPGMQTSKISKIIAEKWHSLTPAVRDAYKKRASAEARQHRLDHPQYRYTPRRPTNRRTASTQVNREISSTARASTSSQEGQSSLIGTSHIIADYNAQSEEPPKHEEAQVHPDFKMPIDDFEIFRGAEQQYAVNTYYYNANLQDVSYLNNAELGQVFLTPADDFWSSVPNDFDQRLTWNSS